MSSNTVNKLFTEIFRPGTLNNMVILPRIYNEVSKGLIQNILLYGTSPGTGKSTLTRILSKGYDTMTINCSEERGIDTIREKIIGFSSSLSLLNGVDQIKVIVLEECDGMTADAFDSLRAVIEKYADSVRFIGNCNNINKIPVPIQSRFNCIPCYPINQEEEDYLFAGYVNYVGQILNYIKCSYTDELLREFVKTNFPDMRSTLNAIQSLYITGATELSRENLVKTFDCGELFDLIINNSDPIENYKMIVAQYSNRVDETMLSISQNFVDYIRTAHPEFGPKIPMCIIAIAEYMNQLSTAIDKMIVLLACVYKLQVILRS
jgi:DNA polymerase III delta prime subunit